MKRLCIAVLLLSGGFSAVGADVASEPSPKPADVLKAEIQLPASARAPRLFPDGEGWLVTTTAKAGERGPFQEADCELGFHRVDDASKLLSPQPVLRILLPPSLGQSPPVHAIDLKGEQLTVAVGIELSASRHMVVSQAKRKKPARLVRIEGGQAVKQFQDGDELGYMARVCPDDLSFVRGNAEKGVQAVCGTLKSRPVVLVRSRPDTHPLRWDRIEGLSPDYGVEGRPCGVWMTESMILVAWVDRGSSPIENRVFVAAVSRPEDGPKEGWKLLERKQVHTGPAVAASMIPTKDGARLAILELTGDSHRVVIHDCQDDLDSFKAAGAMSLNMKGSAIDFSINSAGKNVAGIVSTDEAQRQTLFVHPLVLAPYKPLDKEQLNELKERLEREAAERAKAAKEAKDRKNRSATPQERLQQKGDG